MRSFKLLTISALLALSGAAYGNSNIQSLDQLLEAVKQEQKENAAENAAREKKFRAKEQERKSLLSDAQTKLKQQEARSAKLKAVFEKNEKDLSALEDELKLKMGTLGELFGVVRQVAGDASSQFQNSLVSIQHQDRLAFVGKLAAAKSLPNIDELRKLWFELQREMTESGKVVKFNSKVTGTDGTAATKDIVRVGTFNVVADGLYLQYLPETKQVVELARQPSGSFLSTVKDLEAGEEAFTKFGLDPSRGSILSLLIQAPDLSERVQQGGIVGYAILLILLVGLGIVLERFVALRKLGLGIKKQLASKEALADNPLGRIIQVAEDNANKSMEHLELRLDEAIIKNVAPMEKRIKTVKLFAAIAPLMGLLGTVTGMIATFQSITLFGTGDPKLMASGISQALITTVLGLVAAIPLLLLHSAIANKSKNLIQIIEEQSAGLIARRASEVG